MAAKKSGTKASVQKKSTAAKRSTTKRTAKKSSAKKSPVKKTAATKTPAKTSPVKTATAEPKDTATDARTTRAKKLGAVIEVAGRVLQRGAEIVEKRRAGRKKS